MLLCALALAACNSQVEPPPEPALMHGYSDEELAKLPVTQRCRYLGATIAKAMADPALDKREKKKTYEAWPVTMQKWGCEPTIRVWKPPS
jgi:hypothetical protein